MKRIFKNSTFAGVFLSTTGFSVVRSQHPPASDHLDRIQEQIKDITQNTKDYTFAQKAEFIEKMKTQLAAINRELGPASCQNRKVRECRHPGGLSKTSKVARPNDGVRGIVPTGGPVVERKNRALNRPG
jgi:hypothetical protein